MNKALRRGHLSIPGRRARFPIAVMCMVLVALLVSAGLGSAVGHHQEIRSDPYRVLVFTKTAGFRHEAGITAGIQAITQLGAAHGYVVTATEDSAAFTTANLAQYKTLVFLSTTSSNASALLTTNQQAALQQYVRAGGGWFGIHAAADSAYDWPWFGGLLGGNAYLQSHPKIQPATVIFEDRTHPMSSASGDTLTLTDEWYDTRANPRDSVHVIASVDNRSYSGSTMGLDHPIAWCQRFDGGRSAYVGLGHDETNWSDPAFLQMVQGGIETTAGVVDANCGASVPANYELVTLDDNTSSPMMLDVAADGRVVFIERTGAVKMIDPVTRHTTLAGTLPVFTANESGLLGLALDPGFASNGHLFVFHSPTSGGDVDRLSRFTMGPQHTLLAGSEKIVLDVPVQRGECCHHGGSMVFDKRNGNLFLATGDNTNPFGSDGYAPTDGRPGREAWDARRTSGNSNSLSGKLLRIHPEADGSYTVPAGNLFSSETAGTRPEVYAMGLRNPFRINIDPASGHLFVADFGPDAATAGPRGPENTVEWNVVSDPGNFGWPYCVGPNNAYARYDFGTGQVGEKYDCVSGPTNDSPSNTGLATVPAAHAAEIFYHYEPGSDWAEIGGGGAPMAGPMYRFDPTSASPTKWPEYWDGKALFGEWNRDQLYSVVTDTAVQQPIKVNTLAEHSLGAGLRSIKMMDARFGPDGALYIIDWGSGWDNNNDAGVYRIDYVVGGRAPVAAASADRTSGPAPLTVTFSSAGSRDPEGGPLTYQWDLGDGSTSNAPNPTHTYPAGSYAVQLIVTDASGRTGVSNVSVVSGNSTADITIESPLDGGFFTFGDQIRFQAVVTDAEDGSTVNGTIDCALVHQQSLLGHVSGDDVHRHPLDEATGCSGVIHTLDDGHGGDEQMFHVVEISYTDKGGAGDVPALTASKQVILQPRHFQAEHYSSTGRRAGSASSGTPGVQKEPTGDPAGGTTNIGFIEPDDWVAYTPINLTGIGSVTVRAASPFDGSRIEIRWNSPDGPLLGTVAVSNTGGWQTYQNFSTTLTALPPQTGSLYLVARSSSGTTASILNTNWIDFRGRGMTENGAPVISAAAVTPLAGGAPLAVAASAMAADPEGAPIGYEWSWGTPDGAVDRSAVASHTYPTTGTYPVTLTVRDATGLARTRHFTVQVTEPVPPPCYGVLSDEFAATGPDQTRWTTLVRPTANLSMQNGSLIIPTSRTDLYGAGGDVTDIVLQNLPSGQWEATTKIELDAIRAYQQAGLLLYRDDDNYVKFVLQARGETQAERILQFVHEVNGSPQESNTPLLGNGFPTTVYLRLRSDGTDLIPGFSTDGVSWSTPDQSWSNWTGVRKDQASLGSGLKIGLAAFANPVGEVTNASFDFFHLLPDGSAQCESTDATAPVSTAATSPAASPSGIYGQPVTVTLTARDEERGTGVDRVSYRVDGGWPTPYVAPFQVGGDGPHTVSYFAVDAAGNAEAVKDLGFTIDTARPTVSGTLTGRTVTVSAGDTGSGIDRIEFRTDAGPWTPYTGSVSPTDTAAHTVSFRAVDMAGNVSDVGTVQIPAEEKVKVTVNSAEPPSPEGWYRQNVVVTLAPPAGSSGLVVQAKVGDGGWKSNPKPISVSTSGSTVVLYRLLRDTRIVVGSEGQLDVNLDKIPPTVTLSRTPSRGTGSPQKPIDVLIAGADAVSGLRSVEYRINDGPWLPAGSNPVRFDQPGQYVVTARATDRAGNVAAERSLSLAITG